MNQNSEAIMPGFEDLSPFTQLKLALFERVKDDTASALELITLCVFCDMVSREEYESYLQIEAMFGKD